MSWWLTISASTGVSFKVARWKREAFIGFIKRKLGKKKIM
jgi:hypothetical protein